MWYSRIALLLVCCALVGAEAEVAAEALAEAVAEAAAVATTRAPPRTLDRKAAELAWHSWLQGPENGNQNATHRRITTKSLFITPLVCPKGQRLDRNGCVQIVTVNRDEHEQSLLDSLNALFTSAPNNGDDIYDYGDEEQGPLQLSIPIGLDPQQGVQAELTAQAQNPQPAYVQIDKKGESVPNNDASIEAELELLKLQQVTARLNRTGQPESSHLVSHNVLNNLLSYSDKPKRDSPLINASEAEILNVTDKGQEELVFGHVNIDPLAYNIQNQDDKEVIQEIKKSNDTQVELNVEQFKLANNSMTNSTSTQNNTRVETVPNTTMQSLKAAPEQSKLSPENEYSDIDEAIKLISRYADVSTDDNFAKEQDNRKQDLSTDDSILGTRTKLQYRRNKPKTFDAPKESPIEASELMTKTKVIDLNSADILKYPVPNASPPPHYPFRHLQDYWPGRNQIGGVYNTMHENPRRHHHSYPHYFRPRAYTNAALSESQPMLPEPYPRLRRYPHKISDRIENPVRSHANNQDLYSLLGLRHWFGSEGASKR